MAVGLTLDEFWARQAANRQGLEQEQAAAEGAAGGLPAAMAPRQALETYRNLRSQGFNDDQIERAFARHGWPMPPTSILAEAGRAIKRGAYSSAGAGLEGLGAAVGSPGLIETGQGLDALAQDPSLAPGVSDYTDIHTDEGVGRTLNDAARYVAGAAGQSLPETAAIMGAGLATAAAAPAAPVIAGGAAAFATSFLPNLGRNVQEQIDKGATPEDVSIGGDGFGRAAGAAAGQSALDSILSARIAGLIKGGLVRVGSPSMARRMLTEAAIGAPIEGTTEAAQEAIQILQADPHIAALVTPEGKQRLISSFVGGAVIGGVFEGAAGILPEHHAPAPEPERAPPEPRGLEGATTVGPFGPTPADAGPGTPAGTAAPQDRIGALRNREAGDLFANIRRPIGPDVPPSGPTMADLARGPSEPGILAQRLGYGLGLEQLLPQGQPAQEFSQAIEQGRGLDALAAASVGAPSTEEVLAEADRRIADIRKAGRISVEQRNARRAEFDKQFPQVGEPPKSGPPAIVPAGQGEVSTAAATPAQAVEAGAASAAVALQEPAAAPASPTFAPTHTDTEQQRPVQIADDGRVRTVRYEDGTVREENARKFRGRYKPLPEPETSAAPADVVDHAAAGVPAGAADFYGKETQLEPDASAPAPLLPQGVGQRSKESARADSAPMVGRNGQAEEAPLPDVYASLNATPAESAPPAAPSKPTTVPEVPKPGAQAAIAAAEAQVHPEPTDGQKEAGNYQKGHVRLHGLDISLENAKGSTRSGVGKDGKRWETKLPAAYGYVRATEGADGDHHDVYVASDKPTAFVVDQIDPDTNTFDEHKTILGAEDEADARRIYEAGFSDGSGPQRLGAITPMPMDRFKEWVRHPNSKKPLAWQPKETMTLGETDGQKPGGTISPSSKLTKGKADGEREEGRPGAEPGVVAPPAVDEAAPVEKGAPGGEAADQGPRGDVGGTNSPSAAAPAPKSKGEQIRAAVAQLGDHLADILAPENATAQNTPTPSIGVSQPSPAPGQFGTIDQPNRMAAARALTPHLSGGEGFANITAARKAVAELFGLPRIEAGSPQAKTVDELVKLAGVLAARDAVAAGKDPATTFGMLAKIAERMPNLGTRTSGSVERQAYSTPLPIAYVASRLAGVSEAGTVYEPTAGNGALLIEAAPRSVIANELDGDRAQALREQGFSVTQDDASEFARSPTNDAVIANPPFGAVKNADGSGRRWAIRDGGRVLFDTPDIDQAIAWKALLGMKSNGRAVLIVGAPNDKIQDRTKGYVAGAKQKFYYALYNHYNVVGHYTLSGDLYAKQGAQWPVDLIVIDGVGTSALPLPAKQAPRWIASLDELKGLLDVAAPATRPGSAAASAQPDAGGGAGAQGGQPEGLGGVSGPPGGSGGVADQGKPGGRQSASGEPGAGRADGGVAGAGGGTVDAAQPGEPGVPAEPGAGPASEPADGSGAGTGQGAGNASGGVGSNAGALGELAGASSADLDALLDAALDQVGVGSSPAPPKGVKPRKPREPKTAATRSTAAATDRPAAASRPVKGGRNPVGRPTDRPTDQPGNAGQTTAAQDLKTAATEATKAVDQALTALFKLTGGGTSTLSSGFIFNEETYQAAVPHFKAALEAVVKAGQALKDFAVKVFQQAASMPAEWIRTVLKPMVARFLGDVQAGRVKLDEADRSTRSQPTEQPAATDLQIPYQPRSTGTVAVGTLIPVNMAQGAREAFEAFEQQHGPVDAYVAKKLGYPLAKIGDYFSGEQVDALALAIKTIDDGTGFIIGDQTGVGKGRVNAAIIRYAIKNGMTPIFVTEKPNLYSDMVRDLSDIGMTGFTPLVTNQNLSGQEAIETPDGRKITTGSNHNQVLTHAASKGKLEGPDGRKYDAIFTTYSQLQEVKKAKTPRHAFLERFLPTGVLILDESHNAGGSGEKEERKSSKPQGTPRSEIVRGYVAAARAAFYSSATYAKRPDSMSLYFKTDISKAVTDIAKIGRVFAKGGVPLQQIMSSMLSKAGQYLRRERSFEGVEFAPKPFPVQPEFAGKAANAMRTIVKFEEDVIQPIIMGLKEDSAGEGSASGGDASQISSVNFTAMMHNVIDQMLLSLKADATASEAIEALQRGEKVVIAVANTMGALIDEVVQQAGIRPGERLDFSFKDVMLRYLDRTRWYTEGSPYGEKTRVYISDEELGPVGLKRFKAAQDLIRKLDFSGLPGSPIDHITATLTAAGYRVGEITGRSAIIDYSNPELGPIYRMRPAGEKSKGAVVRNIARFNGGTKAKPIPEPDRLDVFILNQSGATGLSLHASEKFGDQRRRRMIIAQAERNIDTFMQMLGRVHRTGQVVPPAYTLAVADIPAEKRPAAVLLKKMASLNANTTASAESSLDVGDLPDFMNENGDEVAAALLNDDMELWNELGRPLKFSQKGEGFEVEGAMRKTTGRIPLLPVRRQEEVYQQLQSAYDELIERKKAMGENVGVADSLDLDAKTLQSVKVFEGAGASPFSQPAYLEKVDIKRIGKPHTSDEVQAMLAKGEAPDIRKISQDFQGFLDDHMAAFMAERPGSSIPEGQTVAPDAGVEREARERGRLQGTMDRLRLTMRDLPFGGSVRVVDEDGEAYYGIVTGIERKGSAKNPAALGSWRYTIAMADPMRRLTIPVSRFTTPSTASDKAKGLLIEPVAQFGTIDLGYGDAPLIEQFDKIQGGSRETRYMITGNVFAGFNQFNGKGRIAFYTDHAGVPRSGVLMPRGFKGADELAKQPQELKTPTAVRAFVDAGFSAGTLDNGLILANERGLYTLITPKSKKKGGRYFTNKPLIEAAGAEFVSAGNSMVVKNILGNQLAGIVKVINDQFGTLYAHDQQSLARKLQGLPEPKLEDQAFEEGSPAGQVQYAARKSPPTGYVSQPLTPRAAKQRESLIRGATTLAQRMNPRIKVEFAERLFGGGAALDRSSGRMTGGKMEPVAGFHDPARGLIKVALDASDAEVLATTAHEAWHSLEPLLTAEEIATLEAAFPASEGRSQGETIAYAFERWIGDRFSTATPPKAKGIFARLLRFIRELGQMLRGRGFRKAEEIFEAAEAGEIGQRGGNVTPIRQDVAFQRRPESIRYSRQIDDFLAGRPLPGRSLSLGPIPEVLSLLGVRANRVEVSLSVLGKVLLGKHADSTDQMVVKRLPELLAKPVMILNSSHPGRLVEVIEAKNLAGEPILVPIDIQAASGRTPVASITSIYGKADEKWFGQQIAAGRLRYVDMGRLKRWPYSAGLQLPLDSTTAKGNVLTEADLVNPGGDIQFRARDPAAERPSFIAPPEATPMARAYQSARSIALTSAARSRFWLKTQQAIFNRLASVKDLELRWAEQNGRPRHLLDARDSGAKMAMMAMDDAGRMQVAMQKAPLVWDARAGIARPHQTIGGLAWVAESLKSEKDYQDAQHYAYARRAERLLAEGRERLMSDADIRAGLARNTPAARQFVERWDRFNAQMLQFAVDTGVLRPEQRDAYQQHGDYVPFYRVWEETGELMGPNELRRGLSNPSLRIKRLEGGTALLGDLFDNIVKNTATIASAGLRNVAMQRIHGMLTDLGEATDIPAGAPKGETTVSFYEGGVRRWFTPHDDLVFASLAGMRPETVNGIVRGLQKFSSIYRRGITASPAFMMRNWIRGVVGTWVQTGRNVTATGNSVTGMKAFWSGDPIVDAIRASTGFGGYAFGEAGGMSGRHLRKLTTDHRTALGRINQAWEAWEKVGEGTEMADRIALARNLIAGGASEAEAYFNAAYVMPYSQHGAAPWVRFLTLTVPFMNARLQGLARMFDTTTSADERGRLAKRIILRGMILSGFTAALWALNNGDDDDRRKYEAMTLDQRLMYWPLFLGGKQILIPKPFEFGHVFATAVEMALDSATKDTGPRDARALAFAAAQQTFGFDTYLPMPQAVVPAMEVASNWDFFRQRPIENLGVSRLPPEQRTGPSVSGTAEALAKVLPGNMSPLQLDHLIQGYFGLMGRTVTAGVDAVAGQMGFMAQRPSGVFGSGIPAQLASMLGLDSLVRDADVSSWNRWVEDFYRTKQLSDEAMAGAREYALKGQIEDARELIKDNRALVTLRPVMNRAESRLGEISRAMRLIRSSETMAPDEKRRRLDPLIRARNQIAETIMRTVNSAQAKAA